VSAFQFKEFAVQQEKNPMKVGTDGILLGAWVDCHGAKRALDVGTGTGLIALMLAQKESKLLVDGVEINEVAYLEAQDNVNGSSFSNRIQLYNDSIQDFAASAKDKYDLIVSNPPFFTGGTLSNNMDKQLIRHTIKLSHADLLRSVSSLITSSGSFAVIVPFLEGLRFIEIAETYNLNLSKKTLVRSSQGSKIVRLLLSFTKVKVEAVEENDFFLYDEKKNRSSDLMPPLGPGCLCLPTIVPSSYFLAPK